jgi:hypothetical protein
MLLPEEVNQSGLIMHENNTNLQIIKNAMGSTSLPTDSPARPQEQKTLLFLTLNTRLQGTHSQLERREPADSVKSIAQRHTNFQKLPRIIEGRIRCPYCCLEFGELESEGRRRRIVKQLKHGNRL